MVASIHWFRHGLRLHDNPALLEALDGATEFYPIFIIDGEVAGMGTAAYPRMHFMWQSLRDLDNQFREHGGRLYIFQGQPKDVFEKLIKEWGVQRVTFLQDPEPCWIERDNAIKELCRDTGVECLEFVAHTLWDPAKVVSNNGGRPPHTFKAFQTVASVLGSPPRPVDDPNFSKVEFNVPKDFEDRFTLPSLEEMGVEPESEQQKNPHNKWLGGEKEALELFETRMQVEKKTFESGGMLPNHFNIDLVNAPRSLSPHLRFGCLSIRKFYWALGDAYKQVNREEAPDSIYAQLIWREYFICMSFNNPNFHQIKNNPICLDIPWKKDDEALAKWSEGKTGFPWIDACMNQLRQEGWIHHVCRHAVSCFLTRGDLWISWEPGLNLFFKYLLDGDYSICAGNWMWVSSSAFENCLSCPQCFSPILYAMQMDPKGEYTRRYVPALSKMPLRYLFCPWKAPKDVQKEAGCIIGEDYPAPMVDHMAAWRQCKAWMEKVKVDLKNDSDVWHVTPSDMEEVMRFSMLPRIQCSGDEKCKGLDNCY